MSPEFVQLLRDWATGIFWVAVLLIITIGNLVSNNSSTRPCTCKCHADDGHKGHP